MHWLHCLLKRPHCQSRFWAALESSLVDVVVSWSIMIVSKIPSPRSFYRLEDTHVQRLENTARMSRDKQNSSVLFFSASLTTCVDLCELCLSKMSSLLHWRLLLVAVTSTLLNHSTNWSSTFHVFWKRAVIHCILWSTDARSTIQMFTFVQYRPT